MKNKKLIGFILMIAIMGLVIIACGGGGGLSGTFATDDGMISYTFTGNKLTAEALGQKSEATYQLKDGKLIMTSADGKTEAYPYTLSGNTLTLDWHGMEIVLNKK
jgi:hypothetical protein